MLACALADLSGHYLKLSRFDAAIRTAKESLRLMEEHQLRDRKPRLRALIAQAAAQTGRNRMSDAADLYERVLSEYTLHKYDIGTGHLVAVAVVNYADLIVSRKPKEALQHMDVVMSWVSEHQEGGGKDSIDGLVALAKVIQAKAHHVLGKSTVAQIHAAEGLQLAESLYQPLDPWLANYRVSVADIFLDSKQYEKAEILYTAAIATFDIQGIVTSKLRTALANYAAILRKTNRKAEAKVLEERVRRFDESREGLRRRHTVDVMSIRPR